MIKLIKFDKKFYESLEKKNETVDESLDAVSSAEESKRDEGVIIEAETCPIDVHVKKLDLIEKTIKE